MGKEGQRTRIDYFLRKRSNQSNEAQQLDVNHSLQCISTTVMEDVNSSTEVTTEVEPTTGVELTQPPRPAVERRLPGHRPYVKWPGASDKKLWETVNTDLTLTLEKLRGTVEKKLERMGDIIYEYGTERCGVEEAKAGERFQPHQFPGGNKKSSASFKKGDSLRNSGRRPRKWKRRA